MSHWRHIPPNLWPRKLQHNSQRYVPQLPYTIIFGMSELFWSAEDKTSTYRAFHMHAAFYTERTTERDTPSPLR